MLVYLIAFPIFVLLFLIRKRSALEEPEFLGN